jgi:hypothetical protein
MVYRGLKALNEQDVAGRLHAESAPTDMRSTMQAPPRSTRFGGVQAKDQ